MIFEGSSLQAMKVRIVSGPVVLQILLVSTVLVQPQVGSLITYEIRMNAFVLVNCRLPVTNHGNTIDNEETKVYRGLGWHVLKDDDMTAIETHIKLPPS